MRLSSVFAPLIITPFLINPAYSSGFVEPPEVETPPPALADTERDQEQLEAAAVETAGRRTFYVPKSGRGTTLEIPESVIRNFCGDIDGCAVRIGMYDWDNTGRTASRFFLFYYNNSLRTWRASMGDTQGQDANNIVEHVNNSWSCYFTDGEYANWKSLGDTKVEFGLLSWNQYNAGCKLTIID